jgi:hypothetical protein
LITYFIGCKIMSDREQKLREQLKMPHYNVQIDRETGKRAGADGMFQVISITDEFEKDCTKLVDQGTHYPDDLEKLATDLNVSVADIEIEE